MSNEPLEMSSFIQKDVAKYKARISQLEKTMRDTMAGLAETHCASPAEIEVESVWSDNAAWYAYHQLKDALEEGLLYEGAPLHPLEAEVRFYNEPPIRVMGAFVSGLRSFMADIRKPPAPPKI